MSDKLFLLISNHGDKLLTPEKTEELSDYLAMKDWLLIDVNFLSSQFEGISRAILNPFFEIVFGSN